MEYNTNINISDKIKEQNRKAVKKYSEKNNVFYIKILCYRHTRG